MNEPQETLDALSAELASIHAAEEALASRHAGQLALIHAETWQTIAAIIEGYCSSIRGQHA